MVEEDGLDAAELVDTSGRRTGLGGRGYGAAMATAALGCGGERGGAEGGKAQGPRGRAGEWRGGLEASRGCRPYPLSDGDGDRVRWRPASAVAGSGEQGGGRRPGKGGLLGWAAQMSRPAGPSGPVRGGVRSRKGFALFCLFVSFYFIFIYLFSVLFHFNAFRHFLKICFLHNNYQCNIWHPPNIFV